MLKRGRIQWPNSTSKKRFKKLSLFTSYRYLKTSSSPTQPQFRHEIYITSFDTYGFHGIPWPPSTLRVPIALRCREACGAEIVTQVHRMFPAGETPTGIVSHVLCLQPWWYQKMMVEPMMIWMFPKIVVPPKSSILVRFSIINHPFWGTPIFGNTHMRNTYSIKFVLWWLKGFSPTHSIESIMIPFILLDMPSSKFAEGWGGLEAWGGPV